MLTRRIGEVASIIAVIAAAACGGGGSEPPAAVRPPSTLCPGTDRSNSLAQLYQSR